MKPVAKQPGKGNGFSYLIKSMRVCLILLEKCADNSTLGLIPEA